MRVTKRQSPVICYFYRQDDLPSKRATLAGAVTLLSLFACLKAYKTLPIDIR